MSDASSVEEALQEAIDTVEDSIAGYTDELEDVERKLTVLDNEGDELDTDDRDALEGRLTERKELLQDVKADAEQQLQEFRDELDALQS